MRFSRGSRAGSRWPAPSRIGSAIPSVRSRSAAAWTRGRPLRAAPRVAPRARARSSKRRAHAHFAKRARSASATAGWTSADTSPPNRATSRTRLELR